MASPDPERKEYLNRLFSGPGISPTVVPTPEEEEQSAVQAAATMLKDTVKTKLVEFVTPKSKEEVLAQEAAATEKDRQKQLAEYLTLQPGETPEPEMQSTTGGIEKPPALSPQERINKAREVEEIMLNLEDDPVKQEAIRTATEGLVLAAQSDLQALVEPWVDPTFAASMGGGMGAKLAARGAKGPISMILKSLRGLVTSGGAAATGELVSAPFVERVDSPASKAVFNILLGGLTEVTIERLFFKSLHIASPQEVKKATLAAKDAIRAEAKAMSLPKPEMAKVEAYVEKLDAIIDLAEDRIVRGTLGVTEEPVDLGKVALQVGQIPPTAGPARIQDLAQQAVTPPKKSFQRTGEEILKASRGESTTLSSLAVGEAEKTIGTLRAVRNWWEQGPAAKVIKFFEETAPEFMGNRYAAVDLFNFFFLADYKRKDWGALRRVAKAKAKEMQDTAMDLAVELAKFPESEQSRIAQIIRSTEVVFSRKVPGGKYAVSSTVAPERYEKAIHVAMEFKQLKNDLTNLKMLSDQTWFDAMPKKERSNLMRELYGGQKPKGAEGGPHQKGLTEKLAEDYRKLSGSPWTYPATGDARKAIKARVAKNEEQQGKVWTKLARHYPLKSNSAKLTPKQLEQVTGVSKPSEQIKNQLLFHDPVPAGKTYLTRAYLKYEGHAFEEHPFLKHLFPGKRAGLNRWYSKHRKFMSPELRKELGEIEQAPFLVGKGLSAQYYDREIAQFFHMTAKNPEWATVDLAEAMHKFGGEYKIKGKRFGALDGMYTTKEIHHDLMWVSKFMNNNFMRTWNKYLGMWKFAKVPANPGAQFRNLFTNTILADFGDVPQWRVDRYYDTLVNGMIKKDELYQGAKKAFGGEWAEVEVTKFLNLDRDLTGVDAESLVSYWAKKVSNKATDMYQANELFFKHLVYRQARADGLDHAGAVAKAQEHIFDYSDIPPALEFLKAFYSPFITFPWKATPLFAKTLVRKPWKIAKYAMIYQLAWEETKQRFGWSDEEAEARFNTLPEWMSRYVPGVGRNNIPVPFTGYYDEDGNEHAEYLDIGYIFPGAGDMADTWGQSGIPFSAFLPSHPLIDILVGAYAGVKPFSGQPIAEDWERRMAWRRARKFLTTGEIGNLSAWTKHAEAIANTLFPALTPFVGNDYKQIEDAYYGRPDMWGNPKTLPRALVDTFFGLKFRNMEYTKAQEKRLTNNLHLFTDMSTNMTKQITKIQQSAGPYKDPAENEQWREKEVARVIRQADSDFTLVQESINKEQRNQEILEK